MALLLQQLLSESARLAPERVALSCRGEQIQYQELDEASSSLASALISRAIGPGHRVGIWLPKSIESIIAAFGSLKAGAAYVPLDPFWPIHGTASVIRDCGIRTLVTSATLAARLRPVPAGDSPVRTVVLTDQVQESDSSWEYVQWRDVLASSPITDYPPQTGHDLAYILYTSGSTGRPKGVMISHRASLTFVDWAAECFRLGPNDRLSNQAPLHFDLSIFDVFAGIKAGAEVILIPEEVSALPIELGRLIAEEQMTVWYSTPSVLVSLLKAGQLREHQLDSLRAILFAGEVFPLKYLRQLAKLVPRAELYNLFGPTETNVCTFHKVTRLPESDRDSLPIGKACPKLQVWGLTKEGKRARVGEAGELVVQGPSLMTGYWGMPAETAEVLFPPDSGSSEERTYRTGDWVEETGEGDWIFLGRRDELIKNRGYRIELGEIESVLYSHPGIDEVAVVAIPEREAGYKIHAFLVSERKLELQKKDLRRFCQDQLPGYMIPHRFELCASLPKTSTGKIDKSRLVKLC